MGDFLLCVGSIGVTMNKKGPLMNNHLNLEQAQIWVFQVGGKFLADVRSTGAVLYGSALGNNLLLENRDVFFLRMLKFVTADESRTDLRQQAIVNSFEQVLGALNFCRSVLLMNSHSPVESEGFKLNKSIVERYSQRDHMEQAWIQELAVMEKTLHDFESLFTKSLKR